MALINVMENIVKDKLDEMLRTENCCKCDRCIEDMTALALNKLPARYVSTHNGELFSKLNSLVRQNSVDLNIAVAEAIACVSKKPSHN
ncbi:MAG: late competence development ComFB family protein [Oscillospiraceae bacterium]|nr:late competence development ComFB family protein [Oscillospiraceae bacterium]